MPKVKLSSGDEYERADALKESGGTDLVMGAVAAGEFLQRNGSNEIVGAAGSTAPAEQIQETGDPQLLDVGAIADGEFLKRVGTEVVGAMPTGTGHTIQDDNSNMTDRANLSFQDGFLLNDDAGADQTEVDVDYAGTAEIADVAATEAAGTSPKVARGDHVHAIGAQDYEFISSKTLANDATADFVLQNSIYKNYIFIFENVVPATDNATLFIRTSTDGGSSYDAGASDYEWCNDSFYSSATRNLTGDGADSEMEVLPQAVTGWGSDTGEDISGTVSLFGPAAAVFTNLFWTFVGKHSGGSTTCLNGSGQRKSAADVDAIRFLFSSGNLESGVIRMYGIRGV